MTVYKLCLLISFLISIVFPQSAIQISGKIITTDSIPIYGAVVELKKNGVESTTDSLGTFILIDTLSQPTILSKQEVGISPSFYISQNHINLNLQRETSISIEVYDVTGKKIAVLISGRFKTGNFSIPINLKNLPSQVYFFRLKFGSTVEYLKICTIQKDINFKRTINQPKAMVLSKTATITPIDTLIITHNLFQSVKFPVVDTISSIVIVLSKKPSTPQVWAFTDFGKMKDTIISQKDSIFVAIGATDSIDTIKEYYYDIGGNGWCDSTNKADSALKYLKYPTGGYIPIIIGARNNAGFLGMDTFHILFNRPPISCGLKTDYNADKGGWSDFNYLTGKGSIQVSFTGDDPDGVHDTMTYKCYVGRDTSHLELIYSGKNAIVTIQQLDTSTIFQCRVICFDLYGDSTIWNGCITTPKAAAVGFFWNLVTNQAGFPSWAGGDNKFALTSFDNKLWVVWTQYYTQKNIVYNSTDGITWNLVTNQASFPSWAGEDNKFALTSFDNKLWVVWTQYYTQKNIVYNSTDGITWNLVTNQASFPSWAGGDNKFALTSLDNKLWVVWTQYITQKNIVYNSTDGITWNLVTNQASFLSWAGGDNKFALTSFDNKLWIVWTQYVTQKNIVYNSTDGITWNLVTNQTSFPSWAGDDNKFALTSLDNKLWVVWTQYVTQKNILYSSGQD